MTPEREREIRERTADVRAGKTTPVRPHGVEQLGRDLADLLAYCDELRATAETNADLAALQARTSVELDTLRAQLAQKDRALRVAADYADSHCIIPGRHTPICKRLRAALFTPGEAVTREQRLEEALWRIHKLCDGLKLNLADEVARVCREALSIRALSPSLIPEMKRYDMGRKVRAYMHKDTAEPSLSEPQEPDDGRTRSDWYGKAPWQVAPATPHNAAPTQGEAHGAETERRENRPLPGLRDTGRGVQVPPEGGDYRRGEGGRDDVRGGGIQPPGPLLQHGGLQRGAEAGVLELATKDVAHDCAKEGCAAPPEPRGYTQGDVERLIARAVEEVIAVHSASAASPAEVRAKTAAMLWRTLRGEPER